MPKAERSTTLNDSMGLTQSLDSILQDPIAAKAMGTTGHEAVTEGYANEKLASPWLTIFWIPFIPVNSLGNTLWLPNFPLPDASNSARLTLPVLCICPTTDGWKFANMSFSRGLGLSVDMEDSEWPLRQPGHIPADLANFAI